MVVNMLPFALVCHIAFGIMIYSYPYIWKSEVIKPWIGNNTQYFNANRMGQTHVAVFFVFSLSIILLLIFEDFLVIYWRKFSGLFDRCLGACAARLKGEDYDADDHSK